MKQFVGHIGWKLKPEPVAYLLLAKDHTTSENDVFELTPGRKITIEHLAIPHQCIGFTDEEGIHYPCPREMQVQPFKAVCRYCSLGEFYTCRITCIGDVCKPSSPKAEDYCWDKKATVYLTHIAGLIKVGSSTNPIRRWLGQGSDAGIVIAEGVGLAPRALEHAIGTQLGFPMAVRVKQKLDFLGEAVNEQVILEELEKAVQYVYSSVTSGILLPKEEILPPLFLGQHQGTINSIPSKPVVISFTDSASERISGEIIGVKGSILVCKSGETFFATDLRPLIGSYIDLKLDTVKRIGQRSLFEFVEKKP